MCQSRVPGTVIPLCAAQCERMFNTTRIPGDETGNTGAADPHQLQLNSETMFSLQANGHLLSNCLNQLLNWYLKSKIRKLLTWVGACCFRHCGLLCRARQKRNAAAVCLNNWLLSLRCAPASAGQRIHCCLSQGALLSPVGLPGWPTPLPQGAGVPAAEDLGRPFATATRRGEARSSHCRRKVGGVRWKLNSAGCVTYLKCVFWLISHCIDQEVRHFRAVPDLRFRCVWKIRTVRRY